MTNSELNWSKWLEKSRFDYMTEEQKQQTMQWLFSVRNAVLNNANIKPNDTIIDLGTGNGLLALGALEYINEKGKIIFSDKFEDCISTCKELVKDLNIKKQCEFLLADCCDINLPQNYVDKAVMRSVLVHILDKKQALSEIHRILKPNGIFSAFEPIISSNTRCWELVESSLISDYDEFKKAENDFMSRKDDPLTNFDETTISNDLDEIGFSDGILDKQIVSSSYVVQKGMVENWLTIPPSPGAKTSKEKFLTYFEEKKVNNYISELQQALENKIITVNSNVLYIKAIK